MNRPTISRDCGSQEPEANQVNHTSELDSRMARSTARQQRRLGDDTQMWERTSATGASANVVGCSLFKSSSSDSTSAERLVAADCSMLKSNPGIVEDG